jgi:adenylate kinase
MLIITTAISGSGRKEYLKKFEEYARAHHKKVKIYHIGEMLFEQAEKIGVSVTAENVLNTNPSVISSLRSAVLENVKGMLPQALKDNDAVIINLHAFFFWKKVFARAFDRFYLREFKPDFFISFIDNSKNIQKKLSARKQWHDEDMSQEEVLYWQNIECEVTADWAELYDKQFYALAAQQPSATLYKLLFHPELEPVYVSMPMTHLNEPADKEKVDRFVEKLNRYFTVFDPRTVEVDTPTRMGDDDKAVYYHTVNRDLYWLIKQSKKVIAFYPKNVSSPGVINELREAYETNKDVWLVVPTKDHKSPFLVCFCNKVFESEHEFFEFLDAEGYKKIK